MRHEDKNNITGGIEALGSDEQNVSRLLSNLKRVDAPKDFDFHLKARIANASPANHQPVRLFPILKYALPLALFLFVAAAFVLTNSYSESNVPEVSDGPEAPPSSFVAGSNSGQQAETNIGQSRVPEKIIAAENPQPATREFVEKPTTEPRSPRSNKPASPDLPDGGSYTITGNSAPSPRRRKGSGNSNSNVAANPAGPGSPGPLETRQVLRNVGIDASFVENGWKVRSVVKDGVAERSGLRVGDVMEAIDDKPINTLYDGSFSAKSISVRRGDQVVKIDIRPNKP